VTFAGLGVSDCNSVWFRLLHSVLIRIREIVPGSLRRCREVIVLLFLICKRRGMDRLLVLRLVFGLGCLFWDS
jgi:hypothetical protein